MARKSYLSFLTLNTVAFLLSWGGAIAQPFNEIWSYQYVDNGSSYLLDLKPDNQGGFIASGVFDPNLGTASGLLVRLDNDGNELWTAIIEEPNMTEINGVSLVDSSQFVFAGTMYYLQLGDVAVVGKATINGDTLWVHRYDTIACDFLSAIEAVEGGAIVVGGHPFGSLGQDAKIFKVDEDGQLLWLRSFGSNDSEHFEDVCVLADGSFAAAGYTNHGGPLESRFFVARISSDGDSIWSVHAGDWQNSWAHALTSIESGVIVVGDAVSPANGRQVCLCRLDSTGTELWQRTYGGPFDDYAYDISPIGESGNYLVSGVSRLPDTQNRGIYLLCVNSLGDTLWTSVLDYADLTSTWASAGISLDSTVFVVAGKSSSGPTGEWNAFVTKVEVLPTSADERRGSSVEPLMFRASPNPTSGSISIIFQRTLNSPPTLRVCNILGQCVYKLNDPEMIVSGFEYRIDVGSWANGTYFYSVSMRDHVGFGSFTVTK